jgi:type VI secretion system secreted protein Hcp
MALTGYMKLTGKNMGVIDGDCLQKNYEKLVHFYGVEHKIEVPFDKASGERTGRRLHHPFIVTKAVDRASPQLYQLCTTGEQVDVVLQYNRINDKGVEEVYFTVTLSTAQVVHIRHTKPLTLLEANKPLYDMEEVAFAYQKIQWENNVASKTAQDDWQSRT